MVVRLLLLVAAAFLLGGCTGGDDEAPSTSTVTETTVSPLEGASTENVVVPATITETALLTDVRSATFSDPPRIVIDVDSSS